jgi:sialic acid synthase SpsE
MVPFAPLPARGCFDPATLATLAAEIRTVELALGDGEKQVQQSEWALRDRRHRSLAAAVDIPRGAVLTAEMIRTAPPGIGLKPRLLPSILGKHATMDIPSGTLLTFAMIE